MSSPRRGRRFGLRAWLILAALAAVAYLAFWLARADAATKLATATGVALLAAVAGYLIRRRRRARRLRARTLGELLVLTPSQFEEAVAGLLAGLGYGDVRRVGGSGDLGVDVMCRHPDGGLVVVQCKRHSPGIRVGSPEIQALIGMKSIHAAEQALLVTTSTFSRPAMELARGHGVDLIDGEELARIAAEAKP